MKHVTKTCSIHGVIGHYVLCYEVENRVCYALQCNVMCAEGVFGVLMIHELLAVYVCYWQRYCYHFVEMSQTGVLGDMCHFSATFCKLTATATLSLYNFLAPSVAERYLQLSASRFLGMCRFLNYKS